LLRRTVKPSSVADAAGLGGLDEAVDVFRKEEAVALRDDVKVLEARIPNWKLEKGGVSKWGESSERNYGAYMDFLQKYGILKQKVDPRSLITNELIGEINDFDPARITAEAKAYTVR